MKRRNGLRAIGLSPRGEVEVGKQAEVATTSRTGMQETLGKSVEGEPLTAFVCQSAAARPVIVFGGFHGDEPKSVTLAQRLIDLVDSTEIHDVGIQWIIVPLVNPDGYRRRRRRNHNGVDINRNFPTGNWQRAPKRSRMFGGESPASEPETRAVMKAVEKYRPACIVTIHCIGGNRHCNNYDGPARAIARAMQRGNGYPVTATMGYPTPGSFGTWAGRERAIPIITLELPTHHSAKRCWQDNHQALLNITRYC